MKGRHVFLFVLEGHLNGPVCVEPVSGRIGSGKTSACMNPFARQLLRKEGSDAKLAELLKKWALASARSARASVLLRSLRSATSTTRDGPPRSARIGPDRRNGSTIAVLQRSYY